MLFASLAPDALGAEQRRDLREAFGQGRAGDAVESVEGPHECVAGAARSAVSARGLRFGVAPRVLASGALALVALSFLLPYLSESALSRAIVLASDNRTSAAIDQARRAHRLDPLAVDPLFTLALVEQQQGQASAALATLRQAVRLQPQNYLTYYELGDMQLHVLGRRTAAAASLRHALALNPNDDNSSADLSAALAAPATPCALRAAVRPSDPRRPAAPGAYGRLGARERE